MHAYSGENFFYFYVYYLMTPMVILIGIIGNSLGTIVLTKKIMHKIGPLAMYHFLFVFETLYLLSYFQSYLSRGFAINLLNNSKLGCKLYYLMIHTFAPMSPLIMIYISLDRFISIKFPSKRYFFKNNKTQLSLIVAFIVFNLGYKIPVYVNYDLANANGTSICTISLTSKRLLVSFMDFGYRILALSVIMIVLTALIVYRIFESRKRVLRISKKESRILKKDVRLSVTSFMINIIYILLNMPINFSTFFLSSIPEYGYLFTLNLFYLSYAINFYIIIATNSLFRREFLLLFRVEIRIALENYFSKSSKPSNFKNLTSTNAA